jgi:class 3 adenylate cyclase
MSGERVERRLAAVLAADVAGYSRLMGADEDGTLARLKALRLELLDPKIADIAAASSRPPRLDEETGLRERICRRPIGLSQRTKTTGQWATPITFCATLPEKQSGQSAMTAAGVRRWQ